VRRRLFSLAEVDDTSIPAAGAGALVCLGAGRLAGVAVGDVYGVTGIGATGFTDEAGIARVRVERVEALRAFARPVEGAASGAIPPDAVAWPLELALARRAVWLEAPEGERAALEAAITGSGRLQGATAREQLVGELHVHEGELRVLAADGRPLDRDAAWSIPDAIRQLDQLAAAQRVLELEGEHGLADEDVEIEWGTVHPGGVRIPRPAHGAALSLGDRIYLRLASRAQGARFAHVFSLGLRGRIRLLSGFAPGGIRLGPGREELVGIAPDPARPANGYALGWPRGARRDEPGIDTLIVIVTAQPAELRVLETVDATGARGRARAEGSPLQRLLCQLHEGGTRSAAGMDAFFVARRSYVLFPLEAPIAGPGFAIDEDPLALLDGAGPREARALEIRLRGLAAQHAVRLDALVCPRGPDRARVYAARTLEVAAGAPAHDGELLWRGPAQGFVEIYLWIAPARGGAGLGELLAAALARPAPALAQAIDALVARDAQARGSLAGGASAALAHAAGELLRAAAPGTAGLLHTAFVAAEGLGLGRWPASGLYRALGAELGLSIERC